jgi:gas vesicle protein
MAGPHSDPHPQLGRILDRIRDLTEEVRQSADRVHAEAEEARRLTDIARSEVRKGRDLSASGSGHAGRVKGSVEQSLDRTRRAKRRLVGKQQA